MPIEVSNLTKSFGEQIAVNDISFIASEGEIIGFLGPNGAGKTTTFKMLTGYTSPSSGVINVNGVDIVSSPIHARKMIGYLAESNPLYGGMYIKEFLTFVAQTYGMVSPATTIDQLCIEVGLEREIKKKIKDLSKGYKQRVGLAQALLNDPDILILDEPTTGLDANQLVEIRALIKRLGKDKLILFSSHIMQEIEALCDRIIILDQGRKIADNQLDEIKQGKSAGYKIQLEFENQSKDWKQYQEIPGIVRIKTTDGIHLDISTDGENDPRGNIFRKAVKLGDTIVLMNIEEATFEKRFQELTRGK